MRTITLVTAIVISVFSHAQDTALQKSPVEVFFNVSNALVRATGNFETSTVFDEPYLIGLKIRTKENKAIRLGTNFNFNTRTEFTNDNFIRTTTEQVYAMNGGLEWRRTLSGKFVYYYGVDLRFQANNSKTDANTPTGNQLIVSNVMGPGASPFFGIAWMISDRITLFTESHIMVSQLKTDRYLMENNVKNVLEDSWDLNVKAIPPGAIFISVNL